MTMGVKIKHFSGSAYKAVIEVSDGRAKEILSEGEETEVWIHSGVTLTVSEIDANEEDKE